MKKLAVLAGMVLLTILPMTALAVEQQVKVTLPTFGITLNDLKMARGQDSYPLLLYKDMTFMPMTYQDAQLLGLKSDWTVSEGLIISKQATWDATAARAAYQPYTATAQNPLTAQATIAHFPIMVQGEKIDNDKEPYPLLVFRDVTYFPLTWRFAVDEFDWQYSFDVNKGLVIEAASTKSALAPASKSAEAALPYKVQVTGNVVNVRSGAGISAQVKSGDQLTVVAIEGDWLQVQLTDDNTGWIADYLAEKLDDNVDGSKSVASHALTVKKNIPTEEKTVLTLSIGVTNDPRVTKSSQDKVVMTIDNNTVSGFECLIPVRKA